VVVVTHGHWDADQPPYIRCVRFKLEELDRLGED